MIPVAPQTKVRLNVRGQDVLIDSDLTCFSEQTLNVWMERINAWKAYYGAQLAEAEALAFDAEVEYDEIYDTRFHEIKDSQGGSDQLTKAKAGSDPDVVAARKKMGEANRVVTHLKQFLKSMETTQENATSRGHTLRKEMGGEPTIFQPGHNNQFRERALQADLEAQVDEIVGKVGG